MKEKFSSDQIIVDSSVLGRTNDEKRLNDRTHHQSYYSSSKSRELPNSSPNTEIYGVSNPDSMLYSTPCVKCAGLDQSDNYGDQVDNGVVPSCAEADVYPCQLFGPAVPSSTHSSVLSTHKFDSAWTSITKQGCLNIPCKTLSKYFELSSGFHRFMTRFSGRRRLGKSVHKIITSYTILVLVLSILLKRAEGCSSRSTPKPRPPSPTMRPNITFQTYACPPAYSAWYCLNGATCFTVKIGEALLYNCECADGYMGRRCEFKDLDGSYLPSREKVMLETASIAGGATIAVVLVFVVSIALYIYLDRRRKEQQYLRYVSDLPDGPVLQMTVELSSEDLECRPFSTIVRSHGLSLAPITHSNFSKVEKKPIRLVSSASLAINHHSIYHQDPAP